MSKNNCKTIKLPKLPSRKKFKAIIDLWCDTKEEALEAEEFIPKIPNLFDFRCFMINRFLRKWSDRGLADYDRIRTMLESKDIEISKLGMEVIYNLKDEINKQETN